MVGGGSGGLYPGEQSAGPAGGACPHVASFVPAGRGLGDELGHARTHPQDEDDGWRVHLAAEPCGGPAGDAAGLSGGGGGGHARCRGEQPLRRLRQFQAGLSDRRADGNADPDRKSVVEGKSVSVRVDLGGRRIIKKKRSKKKYKN